MLAGLAPADDARDELRELEGARDRRLAPLLDDRMRDAPAHALLAVAPEHVGDFALGGAREKSGRALAAARVHAHVERRVGLETETARGIVELRRGHAEIEQYTVESGGGRVPIGEIGEIAVADHYARVAAEFRARRGDGGRIAVHEQQAPGGTEPREQRTRMAAAAERAVEVRPVGAHGERCERLVEHHGDVSLVLHVDSREDAHGRVLHNLSSSVSSLSSCSAMVCRILFKCACSLQSSNLAFMPSSTAFFSMPAALRWLAGTRMRALPSSSTVAAAPTSLSWRSRCTRLTLDSAL